MRNMGLNSKNSKLYTFTAWLITFIAVIFGWVFFRAVTLDGAISIIQSMLGLNGITIPNGILVRLGELGSQLQNIGVIPSHGGGEVFMLTWLWNISLLIAVILLPNVQDLFRRVEGSLSKLHYQAENCFWPAHNFISKLNWKQSTVWALFTGSSLALGVLTLSQVSEFLYFQF